MAKRINKDTCVNFKALPNSIKKHLQEHVTDKKLHSELENLNILWVDLSRTVFIKKIN